QPLSASAARASPPHHRLHKPGCNSTGTATSISRHSPTAVAPLPTSHLHPATTAHAQALRSETSTYQPTETSSPPRAAVNPIHVARQSSAGKPQPLQRATRYCLQTHRVFRDVFPD